MSSRCTLRADCHLILGLDVRLGWTGDIQVFAPTASYLHDTSAFLGDWLHDLREEQLKDSDGVPNVVIPDVLRLMWPQVLPQAIWGDVAALLPRDLWKAYGDRRVLEDQWESMAAWLDKGVVRDGETRLWQASEEWPQLGDCKYRSSFGCDTRLTRWLRARPTSTSR